MSRNAIDLQRDQTLRARDSSEWKNGEAWKIGSGSGVLLVRSVRGNSHGRTHPALATVYL